MIGMVMGMREKNLKNIYQAALKFLVPLTPEKTYATIVDEALRLVDGKEGSIFLQQSNTLVRVYTTNEKLYAVIPRENGFTIKTFKTGKPFLRHKKALHAIHPLFKKIAVGSDITIALSYENKAIGVLSILSKAGKKFSKRDVTLLNLFSPLAMLAIRKTQLYSESQKALDTRDLFISMASHELKTPLTTINLYTQLLKGKIEKGIMPDSKWVDTLSWEVLRLTLLVNELLRIDQIKTGQLQYNWKACSLREIVQRAVNDFTHTNPHHPVEVIDKTESDDAIHADYDKILQVVFNVLNNAAKFSPNKETVTVDLLRNDQHIILRITDKGKGIAKEDIPNIFNRFYKGHDHTKEGMGLGLYLSKKIIEEHHGHIQIASTVGQGTTVTITLPILG